MTIYEKGAHSVGTSGLSVSVVIPLYNKRQWVARAIRSVLSQSFRQFEVIVVDDGSTDGGQTIVQDIYDSRIRLITQSNGGVSAARNRGTAEAKADLVAFLDADDEWYSTFLDTVLRLRESFPECIVFGTNYEYCDGRGNRHAAGIRRLRPMPWEGILSDYFVAASHNAPPLCSSAIAVRQDAIRSVGGFPVGVKAGEDLLTWARLAAAGSVAYSSSIQSVFHCGTGVELHRVPDADDTVGSELRKLAATGGQRTRGIRSYVALWYKMRASCFLRAGRRGAAVKCCLQSLWYRPLNWRVYVYLAMALMPRRMVRWMFAIGMRR